MWGVRMIIEYSEADTRSKLIDPKLHESGWDESKIRREYVISVGRILNSDGNRTSAKRADYVLFYPDINGHALAVVEAKKASEDPYKGLEQAKDYAKRLDVPFAYSTNGLKIIEYDFFTKQTAEIDRFPSPEELWERYQQYRNIPQVGGEVTNPLAVPFYVRDKKPRYYQEVAVRRAIEEILRGRKRLLLTMATGSGKTFVAFQTAWKLYKSGLVRKILFVVDRVYLRGQAYNAFEAFGNARWELKGDNINFAKDVYFATYQTLYSKKNGKRVYELFDPEYFDLVIIDECHRSGWNRWHDILKYFSNAIHLGLTATPKRSDNVDVYRYFGEPVYEYKLAQGIEDGYLAPPEEIIRVYTNVDKEGKITFKEIRNSGAIIEVSGEGEPELKDYYTAQEFEKTIILPDRTRAIVRWIADFLEKTDPFAKTVIFCPTQRHAREVAALLNNYFNPKFNVDNYAYPIVSDDPEAHRVLRNSFASSEEIFPVVATTVDVLSTGIDVPPIKNVIFLKHVGSKVEFHQIIGRAARLYERGRKFTFRVIDFTGATRLFDEWDVPPYKPKEGSTDWYLNMVIVDDETLEPVKGADVVVHIRPSKPVHIVAGDDGRVFLRNVPREAVLVDVRASGYRPKKVYVSTFPTPNNQTTLTLRKLRPKNKVPITVRGLPVFIEEENKVKIEVRGNKLLDAEYINYTREQVMKRVASLNDLKKIWLNREARLKFKEDLKKAGIDLKVLSLAKKIPEADEFDLLANLLFNAPIVSRDERARLFYEVKQEFMKKFGERGRSVIIDLIDHYRLYGLSEIEDPKVFELPSFKEAYGGLRGVLKLFKGVKGLKKVLEEIEKGLYADLMEG